ncbi:MAG: carboxypeptidase-like regulatory domain-containing protein, partial [Bacteroidota bacterium]|nr:carboxypeptidase-like regulatory domain-containing protein [Bacteroidota bacterium]
MVLNEKTHQPVEFASVYINGNIQGTYTNAGGEFSISDVHIPCQLVVSRVGFELKTITIDKAISSRLLIYVAEKPMQLSGISVAGSSKRKQNIEEFKKTFLGNDYWGKHAELKGDSGLNFLHKTDTLFLNPDKSDTLLLQYKKTLGTGYGWTKDSTKVTQAVDMFCVKTISPVTVNLPLLGYDVIVDINNFMINSVNKRRTREYYIYSRFIPHSFSSEQERIKIEKNRRDVYYNSSRHFCRALFNNQLKENGYLLSFGTFASDYLKPQSRSYIDIAPYLVRKSNDEIMLVGLKGKTLIISYFSQYKRGPVNLTNFKDKDGLLKTPWEYYSSEDKSYINITSDTCIIRRSGTLPEYNIIFSGKMASKCGGALLPDNYEPGEYPSLDSSVKEDEISVEVPAITRQNDRNQVQKETPNLSNKFISNNKLTSFTQHFATFAKDYPQEKVYLHFDNTAYFLGETMWFKAYVVTAERNGLSSLSKTLYTELVTPEGNIVSTKKYKIENGQCHGEFQLPDSMYSGFYEVRAYTRYMLNQEKEYLFSRVFPVYEKPKKAGEYNLRKIRERYYSQRVPGQRKVYEQKGSLSMTFYPEGGNLVVGLKSKVAFKATGKEGENAIVSGEILDAQGNKVSEIETTYLGMGTFEFTPGAGKYTAKVHYNDKEYSVELPQALSAGFAMTVDNTDNDKINLLIQKSPQLVSDSLGITFSCRGKLYASDYAVMGAENMTALSIPSRMLPTGVSQITLFNRAGEVLSERLVFVNHNSQMKISAVQDKREFQPFEKVNMDFQLNDLKGNPVETTFSVAVRDAASSTYNPYNDNILSNLLLSSELKGYIENPGYYFESDDPARRAALDLLMLTQGWSRYVWKEMAGVTKHEVKHPIEKSLVIEGRVLSLSKKKPKPNVEVLMFMTLPDSTS